MDYKDLANLIFPDAKPIEFYEEKYPERDLPEGAMVVRIGPSPTGSVHIGTIYQALLARTIADKTNGVFFMRVEDTDQKREVENGIKDIIDSLKYFDVLPDEGMDTETTWHGEYGPYRQSMRRDELKANRKYVDDPIDVTEHIRNLPEGWHASEKKIASAAEHGYNLQPGQTWVENYTKNKEE